MPDEGEEDLDHPESGGKSVGDFKRKGGRRLAFDVMVLRRVV